MGSMGIPFDRQVWEGHAASGFPGLRSGESAANLKSPGRAVRIPGMYIYETKTFLGVPTFGMYTHSSAGPLLLSWSHVSLIGLYGFMYSQQAISLPTLLSFILGRISACVLVATGTSTTPTCWCICYNPLTDRTKRERHVCQLHVWKIVFSKDIVNINFMTLCLFWKTTSLLF